MVVHKRQLAHNRTHKARTVKPPLSDVIHMGPATISPATALRSRRHRTAVLNIHLFRSHLSVTEEVQSTQHFCSTFLPSAVTTTRRKLPGLQRDGGYWLHGLTTNTIYRHPV